MTQNNEHRALFDQTPEQIAESKRHMEALVEEARRKKAEEQEDSETKTFEFDVTLDELVESGGMDGLNDILESRLSDQGFSYIPSGIDYRAIGLTPGDDTQEGIITILATYTPDYMGMDEEDLEWQERIN